MNKFSYSKHLHTARGQGVSSFLRVPLPHLILQVKCLFELLNFSRRNLQCHPHALYNTFPGSKRKLILMLIKEIQETEPINLVLKETRGSVLLPRPRSRGQRLPAVQCVRPSLRPPAISSPATSWGLVSPLTASGSEMVAPESRLSTKTEIIRLTKGEKKGKLSIMRVIIQKVSASE